MKRALVALLVAFQLVGGAGVARAEWSPPAGHCPTNYWMAHRNGACGWHDVTHLIGRVFHHHGSGYAYCIAKRESRLNPRAKNPRSTASGLFQELAIHWRGRFNPFNPVRNTLYALQLSRRGTDWGAWGWGCGR